MQPYKIANASHMRSNPTIAEAELVKSLRLAIPDRVRSQAPLLGYIADIFIPQARLVIEVDGAYHSSEAQKTLDSRRDDVLRAAAILTLRFTNEAVEANLSSVVSEVCHVYESRKHLGPVPPGWKFKSELASRENQGASFDEVMSGLRAKWDADGLT